MSDAEWSRASGDDIWCVLGTDNVYADGHVCMRMIVLSLSGRFFSFTAHSFTF